MACPVGSGQQGIPSDLNSPLRRRGFETRRQTALTQGRHLGFLSLYTQSQCTRPQHEGLGGLLELLGKQGLDLDGSMGVGGPVVPGVMAGCGRLPSHPASRMHPIPRPAQARSWPGRLTAAAAPIRLRLQLGRGWLSGSHARWMGPRHLYRQCKPSQAGVYDTVFLSHPSLKFTQTSSWPRPVPGA